MYATINNATMHYVEKGNPSGMPVVFLHGFPFSHEMWNPQLEVVGTTHHAIAYDLRGHGESDVGDGQYTIESHVDDLIELLNHLHIVKTVVVGLSMGGYITLRALERNPERFLAAVLCDTRSEADSDEAKLRRAATIAEVKKDGSAHFAEGFVKAVFATESLTARPDVVSNTRVIMERTPALSIAGTLLALAARTDTTASLAAISIPTLILVGELDGITPPAACRAIHERIRNSEFFMVPGAGHLSNLENPDFFNQKLLSFLQRIPSTRQ
jgi:pimeloyl-ACP methyl ester carboxylesterase